MEKAINSTTEQDVVVKIADEVRGVEYQIDAEEGSVRIVPLSQEIIDAEIA